MKALISVVADLEGAISGGDHAKSVSMLRQVTGLFVQQAPRLSQEQIDAFDTVIVRLSRDIETAARMELSASLADVANAPYRAVRDLAFDPSAEVAGPVLERSERLDDDDLVQVASRGGQTHLRAIARRRVLAEAVTDVIVSRGDDEVVRDVAGNRGARFSHGGFAALTTRARDDAALNRALTERTDVPEACMAQLVAIARERARGTLAAEFGDGAAAAATLAATAGMTKPPADLTPAELIVARRAAKGLEETDVQAWLGSGEVTCALVALARMAGVPPAVAVNAFEAPTADPLLFLVRSVRFGWKTLKLLLASRSGQPPTTEELQSAFQAFQDLSVETARRVVRFTAARDRLDPAATP